MIGIELRLIEFQFVFMTQLVPAVFQCPDETSLPLPPPIYLTQSSVDATDDNEEVDEIDADVEPDAADGGAPDAPAAAHDVVDDVDVIAVDGISPSEPQVPVRIDGSLTSIYSYLSRTQQQKWEMSTLLLHGILDFWIF